MVTSCKIPKWKGSAEEAKRTLILDAALRVFGSRGFEGPTMDDVAAEAGYSRRSLYRFFASKDELGAALGLRCGRALLQSLEPLESRSLFDVGWAYFQLSRDEPQTFRVILFSRQWMSSDRPMPLKAELAAEIGAFVSAAGLQLGIREGEPLAAAFGYVEFLFRYRTAWEASGLAGDDDSVRAVLRRLLEKES
jgi:AcrR family transcriptional regulator